jgi:hypothetical protein
MGSIYTCTAQIKIDGSERAKRIAAEAIDRVTDLARSLTQESQAPRRAPPGPLTLWQDARASRAEVMVERAGDAGRSEP